jgi:ABC-type lipoprotein release transport system permease subunit
MKPRGEVMWSNLLSGLIGSVLGSVLGVVGAYYLAVKTLIKTRENERTLTREQASVDSAGEIAGVLLEFKDSLDGLMNGAGEFRREAYLG